MRRMFLGCLCLLATVALTACTPFFYGGVVVFGPGQQNAPGIEPLDGAEQDEGNG